MSDLIGVIVGVLIGIPLAYTVGWLLGAWYDYWPLFKSKAKRCKDCKFINSDVIMTDEYSIECTKWGKVYPCTCLGYTRKWWLFWRSK